MTLAVTGAPDSHRQGCGVGVGPESVVLTGVGVGVGVGKFSSTPTPTRSRSRLQHFFIISFLVKMETKMETEHYVLTADGHDGLSWHQLGEKR